MAHTVLLSLSANLPVNTGRFLIVGTLLLHQNHKQHNITHGQDTSLPDSNLKSQLYHHVPSPKHECV